LIADCYQFTEFVSDKRFFLLTYLLTCHESIEPRITVNTGYGTPYPGLPVRLHCAQAFMYACRVCGEFIPDLEQEIQPEPAISV